MYSDDQRQPPQPSSQASSHGSTSDKLLREPLSRDREHEGASENKMSDKAAAVQRHHDGDGDDGDDSDSKQQQKATRMSPPPASEQVPVEAPRSRGATPPSSAEEDRRKHETKHSKTSETTGKRRTRFEQKYRRGSVIGKGSFATVYQGHVRTTQQRVAIKTVERGKLNEKLISNLEAEIQILQNMSHKNVVSLLDCTTTESEFILVMEYCSLGDLSQFMKWNTDRGSRAPPPAIEAILEQYPPPRHGGLNEELTRKLLVQLADALRFLRDRNLVHRDIKPQNLLLCPSTDEDDRAPVLKLADFGFARVLPNASLAETLCGSPLYMAPEILHHEKYGAKADLWSVGTVLYQMVAGIPPFTANNYVELHRVIEQCNDNIVFPDKVQVSSDVRRVILGLLKKSAAERMGFNEFFAAPICGGRGGSKQPEQTNKTKDTDTEPYYPLTPSSPPDSGGASSSPARAKESTGKERRHSKPTALEEHEYVVVEKRTVQVNALADELAGSPAARAVSDSAKPVARSRPVDAIKRRSSITYGSSPKNALSRALHFAGIRMREHTPVSSSSDGSSPVDNVGKSLVMQLESLATKANVVCLFAQVKFNQIGDESTINFDSDNESPEVRDMERMASGNSPVNAIALPCEESADTMKLSPEATILVAEEALVLYLKVLSLLAKAMTLASNWLSTHDERYVTREMNIIVQWIRQKFNKCIKYADFVKTILDGQPLSGVSGNKLIFDRALEMSRGAAMNELVEQDLEGCESSYSTSMWMLEAVLEVGEDDLRLEPEDRRVVDKFVASISHRLTVLRQKMASA